MSHEPLTAAQIRAARLALDAIDAVLDGLTQPGVDALAFDAMQPLPETSFVSPQQAATALKVSTQTVYRWITMNKIRAIKTPGGAIRIRRETIIKILESDGTKLDEMADAA